MNEIIYDNYQSSNQSQQGHKLRNRLIALVIASLLFTAGYLLYSFSYIEMSVGNSANGTIRYDLLNQNSGSLTTFEAPNATAKKLVKRGSYEVAASQQSRSTATVVKSGGFLTTTKVSLELEQQVAREFVGDNPGPCMYYANELYSYSCGSETVSHHVPATSKLPTYTKKVSGFSGSIRSLAETKLGTLLLVKAPPATDLIANAHIVSRVGKNMKLNDRKVLDGLSPNETYQILPYEEGFLVVNTRLEATYYSSLSAEPKQITVPAPADSEYRAVSVTAQNNSIVVLYSNVAADDNTDGEEAVGIKGDTEVIIHNNGSERRFMVKDHHTSAFLCGDTKLCLLSDRLSVYDIGEEKARYLYEFTGVSNVIQHQDSLFMVRPHGLQKLNVDTATANLVFGFSDYTYCGNHGSKGGIIVCLINNKNRKVAVRLDTASPASDLIDQKIAALQKDENIDLVSAYGKYIYVTPRLGPLSRDEKTGLFAHDPGIVKSVNSRINALVSEVGIDTKQYTVINPSL